MITNIQIQQAVDRLVASAQPSKVILFGSYARGDATEDSDLMVIEPEVGNQFDEMVRLRNKVGAMSVGVDLLVYSDSEATRHSQVPSTALYWAFKEGRGCMTPATEEALRFIQLADDDAAAFRGLLKLPEVKFRLACFHAQQAIEKLLKAMLIFNGIEFQRTHDLHTLATLLLQNGISPPCTPEELTRLNPFTVTFRDDDTDIPLIRDDVIERMVTAMRHWAGEVVK